MKRLTAVLAMGLLMALAVGPAQAALAGSKHDFTATGGTPIAGVTEKCKSCHVPHKPLMNVPLWAHALSTYTYNLYGTNASYTAGNAAAYDASPAGLVGTKSQLCLSCHDGTVAVAGTTYVGAAGNIMWNNNTAAGGLGSASPNNGLMGSHPIAVNYVTVRTAQTAEYADIAADPDVKLQANKVQCTSCHEPHLSVAGTKMLVKSNANSALCTTCHIK